MQKVFIEPLPRQTVVETSSSLESSCNPLSDNHYSSEIAFRSALCASLCIDAASHTPGCFANLASGVFLTRNAFLVKYGLQTCDDSIDTRLSNMNDLGHTRLSKGPKRVMVHIVAN